MAVWSGRVVGWALLLVAILGIVQTEVFPGRAYGFGMLSSVVLGLVACAWVVGLELFLRFFNQYLSRN
jgi:hypothetical protein